MIQSLSKKVFFFDLMSSCIVFKHLPPDDAKSPSLLHKETESRPKPKNKASSCIICYFTKNIVVQCINKYIYDHC